MVYYILNFAFPIPLSYIIYHKSQSMDLMAWMVELPLAQIPK